MNQNKIMAILHVVGFASMPIFLLNYHIVNSFDDTFWQWIWNAWYFSSIIYCPIMWGKMIYKNVKNETDQDTI